MCTTQGTLSSDSNIFYSPLQSDSAVNSEPHKYLLKFPIFHLTTAVYPTKLFLELFSGDTVDLDMKEIGHRLIPYRYFSNSHSPPSFYCAYDFLPMLSHLLAEAPLSFHPWTSLYLCITLYMGLILQK